jgi:hypothetical protein
LQRNVARVAFQVSTPDLPWTPSLFRFLGRCGDLGQTFASHVGTSAVRDRDPGDPCRCHRNDGGGGALARHSGADLHDRVQTGEGIALALPGGRIHRRFLAHVGIRWRGLHNASAAGERQNACSRAGSVMPPTTGTASACAIFYPQRGRSALPPQTSSDAPRMAHFDVLTYSSADSPATQRHTPARS